MPLDLSRAIVISISPTVLFDLEEVTAGDREKEGRGRRGCFHGRSIRSSATLKFAGPYSLLTRFVGRIDWTP
jgi:hypothetical protein